MSISDYKVKVISFSGGLSDAVGTCSLEIATIMQLGQGMGVGPRADEEDFLDLFIEDVWPHLKERQAHLEGIRFCDVLVSCRWHGRKE